jgi:hypothetical protein
MKDDQALLALLGALTGVVVAFLVDRCGPIRLATESAQCHAYTRAVQDPILQVAHARRCA